MVKFLFQGQEISMDGYLDNAARDIISHIDKDNDCIGIVDGGVGSGKSTLAQQLAARIDPTFSIDRACFDADEFKTAIINAKPKQAVIFDEALNGLNIRRTMSSVNIVLTSLLAEIRQKNLFILICLPSLFDMDKSVAIHRSQFLIHVYMKNGKRGYFRLYGKRNKAKLFASDYCRKTYTYAARSSFWGSFKVGYVIDELQYRKKKDMVLKKYLPIDSLEKRESPEELAKVREAEIISKLNAAGIGFKEMEAMGLGSKSHLHRKAKSFIAPISLIPNTYISTNILGQGKNLEKKE
jgi:hypothetical protein